ncbi:GreA/GreB family elongation factor [Caulobacter sp. CCNWLY153]|uniref:GreA/GreB family elongation factor n=1 Tax=unclassified Caulobacter TaxID=2648921 RepID=UPI002FF43A1E
MPASPPVPPLGSKRDPRPPITVCAEDYDALAALVAHPSAAPGQALLAVELERAAVVEGALAANRVRLGSQVDYHDLDRDRTRTIRLCLPHEASIDEHRVSVTAPVGAALLGLKPGQRFSWAETGGRVRSIKVLAVRNEG